MSTAFTRRSKKPAFVGVQLTEDEKENLRQRACAAERSLSAEVRLLIRRALAAELEAKPTARPTA